MKLPAVLLSLSTAMLAGVCAPAIAQRPRAETRIIFQAVERQGIMVPAAIVVSDRQVNQPLAGEPLSPADLHVAKMIEVSYFICQRTRGLDGFDWAYWIDDGRTLLATLRVGCGDAPEMVAPHRLGTPEPTLIEYQIDGERSGQRVEAIPTFDLTGAQAVRWREFVQRIGLPTQ